MPVTLEDWAPYGIGTPDADGLYPDYRIPANLKPAAPAQSTSSGRQVWWSDIVTHWDCVIADLADKYRLDLYDPAVLARPWPGVRTLILSLVHESSRLRNALIKDGDPT
ncbi:hypothetical protein [Demequina flava]|uniref:hypothetical protein n=1 Tax=Demequina flava TaxID=1095025 RepID=UPI0007849435|nr:hypothetical protein [Demequina flava]